MLWASRILDASYSHVSYIEAENSSLEKIADRNHIDKIYKSGEKNSKMPYYILRRNRSCSMGKIFRYIVNYHDKNEYDMVKEMDAANYYKCR